MSKNKVLILVNHEVVIYNFRKELVERLLQEGYEVIISSPHGERIDELIKLGCKYSEVNFDRHSINFLKEAKLLKHYIMLMKEVKPAVTLTYTIKPNIYGGLAAQFLEIPYVANITGLGTAVENTGIIQKISVGLYKLAFRKIQKVFFQNQENMQFFIDHKIANEKHDLLPGSGVNLEQFSVLDYPEDDTVEFVFISRIMKEKGIDQYIEAARYIRWKYPFTRFHVCGFCEEAYEGKLNELENQGIIEYHGMLKDVRKILKTTHCTVHPTYYPEGMSNVLLESAASGRPIITTDRSGTREIVDDKVNGYIIQQQDKQDLIKKIEKFLSLSYEDKKSMGLAGREKIEKEFDRRIVVTEYSNEVKKSLITSNKMIERKKHEKNY